MEASLLENLVLEEEKQRIVARIVVRPAIAYRFRPAKQLLLAAGKALLGEQRFGEAYTVACVAEDEAFLVLVRPLYAFTTPKGAYLRGINEFDEKLAGLARPLFAKRNPTKAFCSGYEAKDPILLALAGKVFAEQYDVRNAERAYKAIVAIENE